MANGKQSLHTNQLVQCETKKIDDFQREFRFCVEKLASRAHDAGVFLH